MRTRTGNPFQVERSGLSMWLYDYVAVPGSRATDVVAAAEIACPDLAMDGQTGVVWTSLRPDGSRYVAIGIDQARGRTLTRAEQDAIKELVEESDDWPLGAGYDVEVLTGLGFLPVDAPLVGIDVTDVDIYRALGVLLRADQRTWLYKVTALDQMGFDVEFDRLGPAAYDALRAANVTMKPEYAGVR